MLCALFVLPASAADSNNKWHLSWKTDENLSVSFTITPTSSGYYSLAVNGSVSKGKLSDGSFDISIEALHQSTEYMAFENYYIDSDILGKETEFKNIYLVAGKTYLVACSYWTEKNVTVSFDIELKKSSYTPATLSGEAKSFTTTSNSLEWFEFTPDKSGDYLITTKGLEKCSLEVYDKSRTLIADFYEPEAGNFKMKLNGKEKYLMKLNVDEEYDSAAYSIAVTKCAKDIEKVEINKALSKVWIGSEIEGENFNYKVTYTDGTSEIIGYEGNEIGLWLNYIGKISDDDFISIYPKGSQKVELNYLCTCKNVCTIKVYGALEMVSSQTPLKENEKASLALTKETVEDGFGDKFDLYSGDSLYKVKVSQTGVYTISVSALIPDGYFDCNFYEDNKAAEYAPDGSGGFVLEAGKEYCLNVFGFTSYKISKVDFKVVLTDHKHSFVTKKVLTPATIKAEGKMTEACKVCGFERTSKISKISSLAFSSKSYAYDGKAKTPSVTIKDTAGKTLKKGTDYTVTYSNNKSMGKATAKVTFKGKYSGTKTLSFNIVPANVKNLKAAQTKSTVKLSWSAVKGATGYRVYTYNSGTKKYTQIASTTSTSLTIKNLKSGTAYTYYVKAYKKVGDTTCKSAAYSKIETATKTSAPKISAVSSSRGSVKIEWDKVSGASGYEVYSSSSKSGTYSKMTSTTGLSVRRILLKSGSTFYYKVRAYKTVGDKKIYSDYSAVRSVKIK